jgi:hypothetical protein
LDAQRTSNKEGTEMSEDEGRILRTDEEQDEVEAHKTGRVAMNDEGDDTEGDDFEAHGKHGAVHPKKV